ncbi:hypothetical protein ABTA57_19420, partial [Acinetobacter baumannii]
FSPGYTGDNVVPILGLQTPGARLLALQERAAQSEAYYQRNIAASIAIVATGGLAGFGTSVASINAQREREIMASTQPLNGGVNLASVNAASKT